MGNKKSKYSSYFLMKVNSQEFPNTLNEKIENLKDKRVILYGGGVGLEYLKDKYPLLDLNVVAIADLKFTQEGELYGKKTIPPAEIPAQEYDAILITLEYTLPVVQYLENKLNIEENKIFCIFDPKWKEERQHFSYLETFKFEKSLKKLKQRMRKKKVVLYGAGSFLENVNKFYDLKGLDVIAVCDKRFEGHGQSEEFLGYKVCAPDEISELNPDYVLVSTLRFVNVVDFLACELLKDTKIKIRPLVKLPFFTLVKEIWNS